MTSVYQSIVEAYFDYCSIVWDDISYRLTDRLQKMQNRAALVFTCADHMTPSTELLSKLGLSNLNERRSKQKALMMLVVSVSYTHLTLPTKRIV